MNIKIKYKFKMNIKIEFPFKKLKKNVRNKLLLYLHTNSSLREKPLLKMTFPPKCTELR